MPVRTARQQLPLVMMSLLALGLATAQAQEEATPEGLLSIAEEFRALKQGFLLDVPEEIEVIKTPDPDIPVKEGDPQQFDTTFGIKSLPDSFLTEEERERQKKQSVLAIGQIYDMYEQRKYEDILPSLRILVDNGNKSASELLGLMYKEGNGVTKDMPRAVKLLETAALAGRPLAQHHLGYVYFFGDGVTKDLPRALMWFQIAAQNYEDEESRNRVIEDGVNLAKKMSKQEQQRAVDMANEWIKKNSVRDEPLSQ